MTQKFRSWAYNLRKQELRKTQVLQCSSQGYFTIVRTCKQSGSLLVDEWIRKLWYTYTMEYYSAIKILFSSNEVKEPRGYCKE